MRLGGWRTGRRYSKGVLELFGWCPEMSLVESGSSQSAGFWKEEVASGALALSTWTGADTCLLVSGVRAESRAISGSMDLRSQPAVPQHGSPALPCNAGTLLLSLRVPLSHHRWRDRGQSSPSPPWLLVFHEDATPSKPEFPVTISST